MRTTGVTERALWCATCPWTEKQLREIPPFEFENWAVIALGGIPNKTQVGDMGIDGRIYPLSAVPHESGKAAGELDFMDDWYPIQVKQGDKVGRPDVDNVRSRHDQGQAEEGFLRGLRFLTRRADGNRRASFKGQHTVIVPLTVREILDEQIAQKLA